MNLSAVDTEYGPSCKHVCNLSQLQPDNLAPGANIEQFPQPVHQGQGHRLETRDFPSGMKVPGQVVLENQLVQSVRESCQVLDNFFDTFITKNGQHREVDI